MTAKRTQILKRFLPTILSALGLAGVTAASHGAVSQSPVTNGQSADAPAATSSASPSPQPSDRPQLTVNGQSVPLDADGDANMTLPGNTHVDVDGDQAKVTGSSGSTEVISSKGNLDVSVHTDSNGGDSHNNVTVSGSSSNNGGSSTSTSTHVFSTDSSHVDVSP